MCIFIFIFINHFLRFYDLIISSAKPSVSQNSRMCIYLPKPEISAILKILSSHSSLLQSLHYCGPYIMCSCIPTQNPEFLSLPLLFLLCLLYCDLCSIEIIWSLIKRIPVLMLKFSSTEYNHYSKNHTLIPTMTPFSHSIIIGSLTTKHHWWCLWNWSSLSVSCGNIFFYLTMNENYPF